MPDQEPPPPLRCPICRRGVEVINPEYPFCSERCRTRDLANWAEGRYRFPTKPTDEDE